MKFESLPDAIVEGKLVVSKDSLVAFERTQYNRKTVHVGKVFSLDNEECITLFDDTVGQFCPFSLKDSSHAIKIASDADVVPF